MNNLSFKVMENGVLTEYKVTKVLAPENSTIKYIVFTDNDIDFYASRYEIDQNNEIVLKPILEQYEWNYIDKYMEA